LNDLKLTTKIVVAIAFGYNIALGFLLIPLNQPLIVAIMLGFDFFFIFYYVSLLIRFNYGAMKFEREHSELLKQAREEIKNG
jgi:heme A synthase